MEAIESIIENFNKCFGCEVEVRPGKEPVLRPDGGTMSWRVYSPEPHGIGFGVVVVVGGWFWYEFVTDSWGCEVELAVKSWDEVWGKGKISMKYWYLGDEEWRGPSDVVFG